jgi:hypothetical protein
MPSPEPLELTPAQLARLAAVIFGPAPLREGIPRPRPPYLPHPRRRLPKVLGVIRLPLTAPTTWPRPTPLPP